MPSKSNYCGADNKKDQNNNPVKSSSHYSSCFLIPLVLVAGTLYLLFLFFC